MFGMLSFLWNRACDATLETLGQFQWQLKVEELESYWTIWNTYNEEFITEFWKWNKRI